MTCWTVARVPAVLFALHLQARDAAGALQTFQNPVLAFARGAAADPAVLYHDEDYYFYSTNKDRAVFISTDLVNWTKGPTVLPKGFSNVWAPEVYHHPEDGRFYMYYTKRYKLGIAVSDRPDGMFEDLGIIVLDAIDAHPFRDDDGRLYLYFTHTPDFSMHCVPMKSPTRTGGPITKCFEISQSWETRSFPVNEGPWMLKHDGIYTMLYSGSDGRTRYYAVGCATAPTPLGPFTKYPDNPVFQDMDNISCSGHGSVTRDRAGMLWHLYHQKIDTKVSWKRDICIDPVRFDENGRLGGTPTRGAEQPMPVLDPDLVWCPEIVPRGAVFNTEVGVSITSRTPDAEIHYTLDGSDPGGGVLYTGPFRLDESAVVKARAFKKGLRSSHTVRETFTRTARDLPENPAPDAAAGNPGFDVFPEPVLDWKAHRTTKDEEKAR